MSLDTEALNPLPVIHGLNATCHVATWYWAALAAQASGQSTVKTPLATLGNIATMAPAAQPAILDMAGANGVGTWNFDQIQQLPPVGSVLVWTDGGTHSAVVTGPNSIHGYNQGAQLNNVTMAQTGHTTGTVANIIANARVVKVIPEATMIAAAAQKNL